MSESSLRRLSEVALIGICSVWGLTFVMVQDAIELLPTMAFLAYRFIPASLIVALVFAGSLRRLPAAGWRAGLLMGLFLCAGYIFQTLGLEETTASNTGFITGLFVVLTPVMGAIFLRERIGTAAWAAAGVSLVGLYLLSGLGGDLHLRGDGLVLVAAFALSAHILATARAVRAYDVGALLAIQLGVCGVVPLAIAAAGGQLEPPRGGTVWSALIVTSLVASALGFFVQTFAQQHAPPARTALILAAEPAFAGLFGWLLADDRLSATEWLGAGLIMAAILAVEVTPRFRPPRPLPEG
jgi:drug/metabolite transporter (DMT)-like permease